MALLTHVTFSVKGAREEIAAFDARVKVLLAEHRVTGEFEEQHTEGSLHYDVKVEGGIPFPPFAIASSEFPDLAVEVEWISPGTGARGRARIVRGALAEHNVENITAAAADYSVAITLDENGYLALALAVLRAGRDEYRGYALTGNQDALFRVARDAASGRIELFATQGSAEWSRAWRIVPEGEQEYREIDPVQPLPDDEIRELEQLAQEFVAAWIWLGNGPREEIAIEIERYQRLGYAVSDANLRSAALHRIKGGAGNGDGALHYTTLDDESKWVEIAIARCWPGHEPQ